jgi:rare lipoprotein A
VRMAFMHMGNRLALTMALCLLTFPLHSLPLHAEEKPIQTLSEESAPDDKTTAGNEGTASYYAKRYNGRRTHSGARYHPEKLTAASPDLPLGCRVKVVNLENGKEVLVTVNDRCRRKKDPFIDLSRSAARKLGFLGRGTARVKIFPMAEGDESLETARR